MSRKKSLKQIKTGVFSRGLALAKLSVSAGAKAATHALGNVFANENERSDRFKEMLKSQVDLLAKELGQLKGSLMKVGQLISMYGEHFLPPEANEFLKSLQSQSPPLEWKAIERALLRQFSQEKLNELEIDREPLASASLGQVHRARRKSDGRLFAMKIQYPGVDAAIEGDLKALQSILSISKLIPKGPKYDELFKEVRFMLHQEVNYIREKELTDRFRALLLSDSRYRVPETISDFCTRRVLTTTLEEGVAVDSAEVLGLPQDRRNAIGQAALELYFRELFEVGSVQTDPHFGNYRIRLGVDGSSDQFILLDFGAVRELPLSFLEHYRNMIRGAFSRDSLKIEKAAIQIGFLMEEDSAELKKLFVEFCDLIMEPFLSAKVTGAPPHLFDSDGAYLWSESDLPKRVAKKGAQMAIAFKLRTPPREIVFLDRKLGGIFIFLSVLKVRLNGRPLLQKYTSESSRNS